ncbi:hypothetical protein [Streptomyces sp. NPDC046887]|uniref:hypothetical protein n=1 Tax=Streptomyces sp. NPDC046887 TaxID=3155472 RepID=UPI0033CA350B
MRRRQLAGASHWAFTDHAVMVPQLQAAGLITAEERRALVGALPPSRSVRWVREGVRGFLARWPAG